LHMVGRHVSLTQFKRIEVRMLISKTVSLVTIFKIKSSSALHVKKYIYLLTVTYSPSLGGIQLLTSCIAKYYVEESCRANLCNSTVLEFLQSTALGLWNVSQAAYAVNLPRLEPPNTFSQALVAKFKPRL